jgi:site-specific DNA-adenine methylase
MKNHFFFSYCGNKRDEVERLFECMDLTNKNIFVEPFCGSCAMSFYISTKMPKKFKYIINDNDKRLIELFKLAKDKKKFDAFIKKINKLCFDKDGDFIDKITYNNINKEDTLESYFITRKYYTIRQGLYPQRKMLPISNDCLFVNFLRTEDVEILNNDAIDVFNQYIDNKNAIIFLDPPYLMSCNGLYDTPDGNIYEYLFNIKAELKTKESLLICCLENMWIIKMLFSGFNFITYNKTYQISKKKTEHIIISNKDLKKI